MSTLPKQFPGVWCDAPDGYRYFLPASLQATNHIAMPTSILRQIEEAALALGELSSLIDRSPDPAIFIHAYTTKEATLSSRIEGIHTSIEDAFKKEAQLPPENRDDWGEVNACIQAMGAALEQGKEIPLCTRLIREAHGILMSQARGQAKKPGEFRSSQNWIGGSRPDTAHFVPPLPEYVGELMADVEDYIHAEIDMPDLIKAALIHYQFETIHPFLDGNGRMGRMLISLYLLEKKILKYPVLYVSTFLAQRRKDYYSMLDRARKGSEGVVEWISFFLDAVKRSAQDGIAVTRQLLDYDRNIREKLLPQLGKRSARGGALLTYLYNRPQVRAKDIHTHLKYSPQISQTLVKEFVRLNILREITGNRRNRLFVFERYIEFLSQDVKT